MIFQRRLLKSCSTCPEADLINKKVRLYKSNHGYYVALDHKHIQTFPLTNRGYYLAVKLFAEVLEFEATEALK
jgi:hypothetical protein